MKKTVEERFWEKVGPHTDPTKCWLWMAAHSDKRKKLWYGHFREGYKVIMAHRFSYEMHYHVIIPPGMTIDHVKARGCTSSLCVNPYHLEMVTNKVNVLRGDGLSALHAKVVCCPQGHPYTKDNTYVDAGKRYCRVCRRERNRKRYHAKKKALS